MVQPIDVKCPACSAPLSIAADATSVTCKYCGRTSQLTRSPTATNVHRPAWGLYVALMVLLAGGSIVAGLYLRERALPVVAGEPALAPAGTPAPGGSTPSTEPGRVALHFDDRPMLADANGDGVLDLIGRARGPDSVQWIFAFDGDDGGVLWRSEPLTPETVDGRAKRAVLLGKVVSVDALGKVRAHELATGALAWSVLLGEQVRSICAGPELIVLETTDEVRHGLEPATGKPRAVGKRDPCAPVYGSDRDVAPGYRVGALYRLADLHLPRVRAVEGMSAERAIFPTAPGPHFVLGTRPRGTAAPMIAGLDARGRRLWIGDVSAVDPLTVGTDVGQIEIGLSGERLVLAYPMRGDGGLRVACFATATGERLWDVLAAPRSTNSYGIAVSPTHVFVTSWADPDVGLSLETGAVAYTLGGD